MTSCEAPVPFQIARADEQSTEPTEWQSVARRRRHVPIIARLEKFCDHTNRCDVAIEQPNHTHHKGNPYRCRIDVTVRPRHELVSDEKQMDNGSREPLNKVIHDAFKTMERQLRHLVEKQRRE